MSVTLPEIFPRRITLDPESLEVLAQAADRFARSPYDSGSGYPGNLWRVARQVAEDARACLGLLSTPAEPIKLMRRGFELGRHLEEVNRYLAVWATLKQKEAEYSRRKSGADAIHSENRSCREDAEKHYLENRQNWHGNISAASRDIAERIVPHKFSTVRRWLSDLEKRLR